MKGIEMTTEGTFFRDCSTWLDRMIQGSGRREGGANFEAVDSAVAAATAFMAAAT